ncbi:MAG TPA: molecular chaperone DnaK, partial [Phaeodactylibacter sp.]|nr:molecular chaperone DnaK [Phaeodactylibacter sp.]
PMANQNRSVGRFILDSIPPAPRGVPQIEVTFDLDANGILNVSAKDKGTGKEQNIRIEASTGLSQEEIDRMKAEAEANAEADKAARERVDKLNTADSLIFQTEKQMKEFGEKISADKKAAIEAALNDLKEAHKTEDIAKIDASMEALNTAWNAASEEIYKASQGNADATAAGANGSAHAGNASDSSDSADDVTDVEYEEVDDTK